MNIPQGRLCPDTGAGWQSVSRDQDEAGKWAAGDEICLKKLLKYKVFLLFSGFQEMLSGFYSSANDKLQTEVVKPHPLLHFHTISFTFK